MTKILKALVNWQPTLTGSLIRLRPLVPEDFDALFAVASDPLIWEQHPDRERYTLERFEKYFQSAVDSRGAFIIHDLKTDKIIGSSRFTGHNSERSHIEVGYTFLTREHWGGKYNLELKKLMLDYSFQFVNRVYFVVGSKNIRSQRALSKIGATPIEGLKNSSPGELVFKIDKSDLLA